MEAQLLNRSTQSNTHNIQRDQNNPQSGNNISRLTAANNAALTPTTISAPQPSTSRSDRALYPTPDSTSVRRTIGYGSDIISHVGEQILIQMYRSVALDSATIKNLANTSQSLRRYIINSEKTTLAHGRVAHNTLAAISVCPALYQGILGMTATQVDKFFTSPAGRVGVCRLTTSSQAALVKLLLTDEQNRSIRMLIDAGIIDEDEFFEMFWEASEQAIEECLTGDLQHTGDITATRNQLKKEFSLLKSNAFLYDWIEYGYPSQRAFSLELLREAINYNYSNLADRHFSDEDFSFANLCGSCADRAHFYRCAFTRTTLKDVTMYNATIKDVVGYIDADYWAARELTERGVTGLIVSDYKGVSSDSEEEKTSSDAAD